MKGGGDALLVRFVRGSGGGSGGGEGAEPRGGGSLQALCRRAFAGNGAGGYFQGGGEGSAGSAGGARRNTADSTLPCLPPAASAALPHSGPSGAPGLGAAAPGLMRRNSFTHAGGSAGDGRGSKAAAPKVTAAPPPPSIPIPASAATPGAAAAAAVRSAAAAHGSPLAPRLPAPLPSTSQVSFHALLVDAVLPAWYRCAADSEACVRRNIAASLHHVAAALGPQRACFLLTAPLLTLLRDPCASVVGDLLHTSHLWLPALASCDPALRMCVFSSLMPPLFAAFSGVAVPVEEAGGGAGGGGGGAAGAPVQAPAL